MSDNYKFFQNTKCEYYPCHKLENEADFNCLFCFCPLYMLKDKCGGNFTYTNGHTFIDVLWKTNLMNI